MFFQRKKKRLLRELWRSRLPKPPSLLLPSPPPPSSGCYGPCSPSSGNANCPATRVHPHSHSGPAGCAELSSYCCEDVSTTVKRRTSSNNGGGGGFCLMGHCCGQDAQSTCSSMDSSHQNHIYADEEAEEKAFLAFLGKTLAQRQLETLLESANARAGKAMPKSACVLIRRQEAMNWSEDLQVIACRMWRWTDLDMRTDVLKRIPSCPNGLDPVYICCNPSHWFRVLQPELPPPPYSAALEQPSSQISVSDYGRRLNSPPSAATMLMDLKEGSDGEEEKRRRPDDLEELPEYSVCGAPNPHQHLRPPTSRANCRADDSSTVMPPEMQPSWSTHGQDRMTKDWCSLAYWEQSVRVGAVAKVDQPTVNVVSEQPCNEDVCLTSLAAGMPKLAMNAATRSKIAAGITISHEGDSMWLYNRSTGPVFVHSLTICDVDSFLGNSSMIMKLYPGYCMRAYNPRARMDRFRTMAEEMALGPVDVHSVRISFLKGWGQTYKRQDIKSCPCWLEVILNPCHFQSSAVEEVEDYDRFSVDS